MLFFFFFFRSLFCYDFHRQFLLDLVFDLFCKICNKNQRAIVNQTKTTVLIFQIHLTKKKKEQVLLIGVAPINVSLFQKKKKMKATSKDRKLIFAVRPQFKKGFSNCYVQFDIGYCFFFMCSLILAIDCYAQFDIVYRLLCAV